jgi:hypothetical protein
VSPTQTAITDTLVWKKSAINMSEVYCEYEIKMQVIRIEYANNMQKLCKIYPKKSASNMCKILIKCKNMREHAFNMQ